MDTAVVILLVLASLVVLGLSLSNYIGARRSLAAAEEKAESAQEGFLEMRAAVQELEAWASDYISANEPVSRSEHHSVCLVKPEMNRREYSVWFASNAGWQAALPALAGAEKYDGAVEEHFLVLFRWAMASNSKESVKWYVNELRDTPISDVACKWLLQDSAFEEFAHSSKLPARAAAYLKGSVDSSDPASNNATRPELAF